MIGKTNIFYELKTDEDFLNSFIEKNLTSIKTNAKYIASKVFYGNNNLIEGDFPFAQEIRTQAFANCSSLSSISFPVCDIIGSSAFLNCLNLQSINFPKCQQIYAYAFANCSNLVSISFPECVSVSGNIFSGCLNLSSLYFPKCSTIGYGAFASLSNITTAIFPEVTYIGPSAFIYCYNLSEINFNKCTSIDARAFESCCSLTSISFPWCRSINAWAFLSCSNLTFISLPNCTEIGQQAFASCTALSEFYAPKCNTIGQWAFLSCSNLLTVDLPECKRTNQGAFQSCSNIININLPKCSDLGSQTFYGCSNLTTLTLFSKLLLSYKGTDNFASLYKLKTFSGGFEDIIPSRAFLACSSLEELSNIAASIIYPQAFAWCNSLSRLTLLTGSCTLQDSNCFSQTPFIDSSYLGYYGSIYVIPTKVESFKQSANWSYFSDRIVALDSSYLLSKIFPYEFYNDPLSEIPSERTSVSIIDFSAFGNCSNLEKVNLVNLEYLGSYAFASCNKLSEVYLPESFTTDRNCTGCFYSCNMLTTVSWPGASFVSPYMFARCSALSDISFLENCFEIDAYGFDYCINITKLSLPNLNTIGAYAFRGCSNISYINLPNLAVVSNYDAFEYVYRNLKYISLANMRALDGIQKATKNATKLSLAVFPEANQGMTLSQDYNLQDVWAPKINYLRNYCFQGCSKLSELYFDNLIEMDSYGVFQYCSSLTSLYIAGSSMCNPGTGWGGYNAFSYTPIYNGSGYIYVRNSLVNVYRANSGWNSLVPSSKIVGLTNAEFEQARERIKNRIEAYSIIE